MYIKGNDVVISDNEIAIINDMMANHKHVDALTRLKKVEIRAAKNHTSYYLLLLAGSVTAYYVIKELKKLKKEIDKNYDLNSGRCSIIERELHNIIKERKNNNE